VHRSLSLIRSLGCGAGLVLTPSASLEHCRHVLDQMDMLLLMSVNPGFGGQSFIPSALQVTYIICSINCKLQDYF
jgi:ribulose-phosphate 3-epimerase